MKVLPSGNMSLACPPSGLNVPNIEGPGWLRGLSVPLDFSLCGGLRIVRWRPTLGSVISVESA